MTDYDLTEAIRAAHTANCHVSGCTATSEAEAAVLAALPVIEVQVRERVACAIEATRTDVALDHGGEPAEVYVRGLLFGMDRAARIARGGAS